MSSQLLGQLRQEDHKFKACLSYRVSSKPEQPGEILSLNYKWPGTVAQQEGLHRPCKALGLSRIIEEEKNNNKNHRSEKTSLQVEKAQQGKEPQNTRSFVNFRVLSINRREKKFMVSIKGRKSKLQRASLQPTKRKLEDTQSSERKECQSKV